MHVAWGNSLSLAQLSLSLSQLIVMIIGISIDKLLRPRSGTAAVTPMHGYDGEARKLCVRTRTAEVLFIFPTSVRTSVRPGQDRDGGLMSTTACTCVYV